MNLILLNSQKFLVWNSDKENTKEFYCEMYLINALKKKANFYKYDFKRYSVK